MQDAPLAHVQHPFGVEEPEARKTRESEEREREEEEPKPVLEPSDIILDFIEQEARHHCAIPACQPIVQPKIETKDTYAPG